MLFLILLVATKPVVAVVVIGVVAVLVLVLIVPLSTGYFGLSKVRVVQDEVRISHFIGPMRSRKSAEISSVYLCSLPSTLGKPMRKVVIADRQGHALDTFNGFFWDANDWRLFARAVGAPISGDWAEVVSAETLEGHFPGAVGLFDKDPRNVQLIWGGLFVVILIVVVGVLNPH